MADSVASILRRSLGHLASEVPESYRHLVTQLGRLVVEVATGGEVFTLRAHRGRLQVVDGTVDDLVDYPVGAAVVRISTDRAAILDVLDGETSLAQAAECGRLEVRGTLDDVLRAHDALMAYAHAAVRAPSVPGLLDALRAGSGRAR